MLLKELNTPCYIIRAGAFEENMAVSMVSLGKETPVDKPYLLFQKLRELKFR